MIQTQWNCKSFQKIFHLTHYGVTKLTVIVLRTHFKKILLFNELSWLSTSTILSIGRMFLVLHFFSMKWCSKQDFPVPALPMTRNLNKNSKINKKKVSNMSRNLLCTQMRLTFEKHYTSKTIDENYQNFQPCLLQSCSAKLRQTVH